MRLPRLVRYRFRFPARDRRWSQFSRRRDLASPAVGTPPPRRQGGGSSPAASPAVGHARPCAQGRGDAEPRAAAVPPVTALGHQRCDPGGCVCPGPEPGEELHVDWWGT